MAFRRPIVEIVGPSGANVLERLAQQVPSITITDQVGHDSDSCEIRVRTMPPYPPAPAKGTRYRVSARWSDGGPAYEGVFSVQRVGFGGDAGGGYEMTVICRAADLPEKLTTAGREAFDDRTLGDIARMVAGKAGYEAVVDPALDGLKIPYRLRNEQSRIDFLTELAAEFGGAMKVAGNRLLITARGSGRSAGGQALPVIRPRFVGGDYGHQLDIEGRGAFKAAETCRFDAKAGRLVRLRDTAGDGSGTTSAVHPAASEDEAKAAARARRQEALAATCEGHFEMPGAPDAFAGAEVRPEGYGPDIDGAALVASEVVHEISADGGWKTTVSVERKAEPRAGGGSSGKGRGGAGDIGPLGKNTLEGDGPE